MDILMQQRLQKITENKIIYVDFFDSNKWKEIDEIFNKFDPHQKRSGSDNNDILSKYIINFVGNRETYGTYEHPKLIHFVAEWCNIEYVFKVNSIMNNINEIKNLEHKDGNEYINDLINKQKYQIKRLKEDNNKKQEKINELLYKVNELLKENKCKRKS